MREVIIAVAAALGVVLSVPAAGAQEDEDVLVFAAANSRPTFFSIHNIGTAHVVSRGRGVRIGILDHSFGMDAHPSLYAGGENFLEGRWAEALRAVSSHGYWMALTTREIAPEAEIYALNTASPDDATRADAMVRAIDWAIAHKIDVLTYSQRRFPPAMRQRLDSAVARAHAAGIVTTFIHYPAATNILPTWIGPRTGDDEREPDVNVLQYDYTVLFPERYRQAQAGNARGYVPFLSLSSTSVVTGGIVALMRSVNPRLTPDDCRRILVETSRPMSLEGKSAPHVLDAYAAVTRVREAH